MKPHERYQHAAVKCRENDWRDGDLLVGPVIGSPFGTPDDGSARAIVLTAIGRNAVLGVHCADCSRGRWFSRPDGCETSWPLLHHTFRRATEAEAAAVRRAVGDKPFDRLTGRGER